MAPKLNLIWPFPTSDDGLDDEDIRHTAYEIFFTSCRASPGFSSARNPSGNNNGGGGSRLKRALGLKMSRRYSSARMMVVGSSPSGSCSPARGKRTMTSAEIMRQQMGVTEESDVRLRKTLMRTFHGQSGRRAETIILPLELLRHLKPSEFASSADYHQWQKRQLKVLQSGLVLHPITPLPPSVDSFAARLREIVISSDSKPIDASKSSETMRSLSNSVVSLAWRYHTKSPPADDACHVVDGHPLNLRLYLALLRSIFDEIQVLDEVDELIELIRRVWTTLDISKGMHAMCLMWILLERYVVTNQVEPDLINASLAVMGEVAGGVLKGEFSLGGGFGKVLAGALTAIREWVEIGMFDYHNGFWNENVGKMENLLPMGLLASKILEEDLGGLGIGATVEEKADTHVDFYIRSSMKNAFTRLLELRYTGRKVDESQNLLDLAEETEELATKEKECFSPVLKKWHPFAAGVAAVALHSCYGVVLKQYLAGLSILTNQTILVLQRSGQLEKALVQMIADESVECDDGSKMIAREMVPYEVDLIISKFLKTWIDERLSEGHHCIQRAKDTETWNPKSKLEPHALSAVEIVRVAERSVDDFLEIPIGISEIVVQDFAHGLELFFRDYTTFVGSCGSKQNYIPPLPPLTRCNKDSKLIQLWRKTCSMSITDDPSYQTKGYDPRQSTSRGTQRLYIRLNTLHYLHSCLQSLSKTLSLSPKIIPSALSRFTSGRRHLKNPSSYFELARSSIQAACQHVSEVAAHRLIFLDSNPVFYETLYAKGVANSRIRPVVRALKQNLILLGSILTDGAQAMAVREVMRASFEAFLMVLLAGGRDRVFERGDYSMVREDLKRLENVFCSCGEGLIDEEVVAGDAEVVEGVVWLMGVCSEKLIRDFKVCVREGSVCEGGMLPMPPTTGRWNRSDPNTILRVLCHRNDREATRFLKRSFQLAKRWRW